MTQARLELDDHTLRVLDVIKGKFRLKNRSEALSKFAKDYGQDFVDFPLDKTYLEELDKRVENHYKNKGFSSMTLADLDDIFD